MYKIQLLDKISPIGLAVLKPDKYQHDPTLENPDGIILRSADMHKYSVPSSLLAVARAGAGTNNIPIPELSAKGIVVFNTPGANANAVKELVMEALLLSSRRVYPAMQWVQTLKGQGEQVEALAEKQKAQYAGPELSGKKLGVIGLGAIGIKVANMARHFGMEVHGYDPYISIDAAWQLSRSIIHAETLDQIFGECDFITLHVPFSKETQDMISTKTIAKMKDGVRVLNFSRGGLVNNQDMVEAIKGEKVNCYITDFAADELLGYPNILVLPHLGASTPESEENCAEMAARQMRDFLENGNVRNAVNLPDVHVPRTGLQRITVFHQNKPAMLAQISGAVGENINNLINNSKGDFAYTMLDLDKPVSSETLENINKIQGVIRVRLFG